MHRGPLFSTPPAAAHLVKERKTTSVTALSGTATLLYLCVLRGVVSSFFLVNHWLDFGHELVFESHSLYGFFGYKAVALLSSLCAKYA